MTESVLQTPAARMCDECGKRVVKIFRIHKGHKYCGACYKRVFKRRMCPKCGDYARLPTNDLTAICLKCQVAKPCARCGKTDYEVAKITPYGPVCGTCAHYFREPGHCESCGKKSTRLARVNRLGHDLRVCPKCARVNHGTCEACHRNRLLGQSADGRMLCTPCREKGEVPCTKCGQPMPAGRGKECETCYWRRLLERRVAIDRTALSAPKMAEWFQEFGEWLCNRVGENKAAITLHRYLTFFQEIEKQWKTIPKYEALLAYFGAARLRRVLLPMRWLEESGLVALDAQAREEDSDRRRIAATLDKVGKSGSERTILDGYYKVLMADMNNGKTTIRSLRLALTPAANLLLKGRQMGRVPPDQGVLDVYLAMTPGQRAAVSGFVSHLRDTHEVEVTLPKSDPEKVHRNRRKRLEAEMLALLREGGDSESLRRGWLSVALAYFHGLPTSVGLSVKDEQVTVHDDGGMTIVWCDRDYWIPEMLKGLRPPHQ